MHHIRILIGSALLLPLATVGERYGIVAPRTPPDAVAGDRTRGFIPPTEMDAAAHGTEPASPCTNGCARTTTIVPQIKPQELDALLLRFATEPLTDHSQALDALLFHGPVTSSRLAGSPIPLHPARRRLLETELARSHARFAIRLIDERGSQRAALGPVSVPLGIRQHLHMTSHQSLQPVELSGTIVRVGLHHLWTRL